MIRPLASCLAIVLSTGAAHAESRLTYYPAGPKAPFSTAAQVDDMLYLSGQIGLNAEGKLAEGLEGQTRQIMTNIQTTLAAHGGSLDDVFKCTVFLADMSTWGQFNKVYVTYFKPDRLPTRSALGANGLAANAALELECVAFLPRERAH